MPIRKESGWLSFCVSLLLLLSLPIAGGDVGSDFLFTSQILERQLYPAADLAGSTCYRIDMRVDSRDWSRLWADLAGVSKRFFVPPASEQWLHFYAFTPLHPEKKLAVTREVGVDLLEHQITTVFPRQRKFPDFELGQDEAITEGRYEWHASLHRAVVNAWRPLIKFSCRFQATFLEMERRDFLFFDFSLPKIEQREGVLSVVSRTPLDSLRAWQIDGFEWRLLPAERKELRVDFRLLPGKGQKVKLECMGRAKVEDLFFISKVPVSGTFFGATYFVSGVDPAAVLDFDFRSLSLRKGEIVTHARILDESGLEVGRLSSVPGKETRIPLNLAKPGYYSIIADKFKLYFSLPEILTAGSGQVLSELKSGTIWTVPWTQKIGRDSSPPSNIYHPPSSILARPGAKSHVQFIITPKHDGILKKVRACGVGLEEIEFYEIGYVETPFPTDDRGFPGLWPDPLYPVLEEGYSRTLKKGLNHPYLISFALKKMAPNKTRLDFEGDLNGEKVRFSVPVKRETGREVRDIPMAIGVDPDKETGGPMLEYFRSLGFSPLSRLPHLEYDEKKGSFSDRELESFLNRFKAEGSFRTFSLRLPRRFGFHDYMSDGYLRLLPLYGQALVDVLKRHHYLERVFFYEVDEPTYQEFPVVKRILGLIKRNFPGVPILLTEQPESFLKEEVDIWVPAVHLLLYSRKKVDFPTANLWTYVCTIPRAPFSNIFIDQPGSEHVDLVRLLSREKLDGFLYFSAGPKRAERKGDLYICDPNPRLMNGGYLEGNGDGFLFYELNEDGKVKVIPSIRALILADRSFL